MCCGFLSRYSKYFPCARWSLMLLISPPIKHPDDGPTWHRHKTFLFWWAIPLRNISNFFFCCHFLFPFLIVCLFIFFVCSSFFFSNHLHTYTTTTLTHQTLLYEMWCIAVQQWSPARHDFLKWQLGDHNFFLFYSLFLIPDRQQQKLNLKGSSFYCPYHLLFPSFFPFPITVLTNQLFTSYFSFRSVFIGHQQQW